MRTFKRIGVIAALCFLALLPACGDENPAVMQNGVEGFSAEAKSDSFLMSQVRTGGSSTSLNVPLDILWVIDNSGSMGKWQQQVQTNTQSFMQQFAASTGSLDWKMGLLSSTLSDQPFAGFTPTTRIESSQSDRVSRFQSAVGMLGTGGDSVEREFDPIKKALSANASFLRADSLLVIIMITDAREQSSGSVQSFIDYLKSVRGGTLDNVATYAVLGATDLGCASTDPDSENYKSNSRFKQFIDATKGSVYPLCTDFSTNLLAIAKNAVTKSYTAKAKLSSKAIPESIKVIYDGREVASSAWEFDEGSNTVFFTSLTFWSDTTKPVDIQYGLASISE